MVTTKKMDVVNQKLDLFKGFHRLEVASQANKRDDTCNIIDDRLGGVFAAVALGLRYPTTKTQLYQPTASYDAGTPNTSATVDQCGNTF